MNHKKIHVLSERLVDLKDSCEGLEKLREQCSGGSRKACRTALSALNNNILITTKELYKARGLEYFPIPVVDGNAVTYLLFRNGGLDPVVARLDPAVADAVKEAKTKLYASFSGCAWHLAGKNSDGLVFRVARRVANVTDSLNEIVLPKNGDVFDCRCDNLKITIRSEAIRKRFDKNRDNGIQKFGEKWRVSVYVPERGCAVYGGMFTDLEGARDARDGVLENERTQDEC